MKEKFGIYTNYMSGEMIAIYDTHKELDDAFNTYTEQGRKLMGIKKVKISWRVI